MGMILQDAATILAIIKLDRIRTVGMVAGLLLALVIAGGFFLLVRDRASSLLAATTAQGNIALSLDRDILRNIDIYDLSLRAAASGLHLLQDKDDPETQNAILFDGSSAAKYFRPSSLRMRREQSCMMPVPPHRE